MADQDQILNELPTDPQGDTDTDWGERKKAEALARRRKRLKDDKVELSITSLMDIMTILLVFLIISITSDPLNVKQDTNLQLARSNAIMAPQDDSIAIIITRKDIIVDNTGVVNIKCKVDNRDCTEEDFEQLNTCETDEQPSDICKKRVNFFVEKADKEKKDADSVIIEPLRKKLDELVKQQITENKQLGRKFQGIVTLVADKEIPFRLLVEVVYTTGKVGVRGEGGLSQIRFAILKVGGGGE